MIKSGKIDYLIFGLGNPGKSFHFSPHNAGALAARILIESINPKIRFKQKKGYLIAYSQVENRRLAIILPRLYINSSGVIAKQLMAEFNLAPEKIIILYDEADFPMGVVKMKKNGGDGGHRGVKSVIKQIDSNNFYRVRIGIGRPNCNTDNMVSHVLQQLKHKQKKEFIHSAVWGAMTCLQFLSEPDLDKSYVNINQKNTKKIIQSQVLKHEENAWKAAHRTKVTVDWKIRLREYKHMYFSLFTTIKVRFLRKFMPAKFVAITGSFAKTTTKDTLLTLLQEIAPVCATRGNENDEWGHVETISSVKRHHKFCVVEVGTEVPGTILKSAQLIKPEVAIVTWVAGAHSNNFPDLDAVAQEKSMLVRTIRKDGLVILNADDERVLEMRNLTNAKIVTYGFSEKADYRITDSHAEWPSRLHFKITYENKCVAVTTKMVGLHWSHAITAAIAAANQLGLSLEQAALAAKEVEPHRARLQPVTLPNGVTFLRDEADPSIHSARVAFDLMSTAQVTGRRITVIGSLKDTGLSKTNRDRQIAIEAAACTDMLIFLAHHEILKVCMNAAIESGLLSTQVKGFSTIKEIADFLRSELKPGDLVLLKGRTSEHLTRILFYQTGEIMCWENECSLRIMCDECPKLEYSEAK